MPVEVLDRDGVLEGTALRVADAEPVTLGVGDADADTSGVALAEQFTQHSAVVRNPSTARTREGTGIARTEPG
jgi:hypothetical protein